MTIYTFPSVVPNESQIDFISNTQTFVSPISGAVQTVDRGGERLIYRMSFRNLQNPDRALLIGFIAQLNGQQHRFQVYNHAEENRGVLSGTPQVVGAGQTGNTLNIDGVGSVNNWMRTGDFFSVNGELKISTSDINSSGGTATLQFSPRLRVSPADNDPVTVSQGVGTFMLLEPQTSWANRPNGLSDFTIVGIEDIAA